MKIRFDRLNRGIILAVVLAIGTAAYVVAQNISFKNSIPEIGERAEKLGQEFAETNIGSNEDAVKRKQTAFVQNNFLSEKGGSMLNFGGISMNKSNFLYDLNSIVSEAQEGSEVYSAKYVQKSVKVKKSGSTGANVSVDYEITFDCSGTPSLFGFSGRNETDYMFDDDADKDARKTITVIGEADIYMLPDGKEWKIANVTASDSLEVNFDNGGESDE